MADTDTGPELPPVMTPGAQAALMGGDALAGGDDEAYRRLRRQELQRQMEREQKSEAREEQIYAEREKEMEPQRRALEKATQEFSQRSELETNRLMTTQRDLPKFDPDAAKGDAMAWMSLAAGMGAIAGGLSRYHTTAALNAFSGMMNGFAKGQLEVYQQKYQEWQANSDRAHELNARALREYQAVMNNAKLNLDAKSNLMQMTAEKYQDQLMAVAAQQRSIERMTQLMDAQDRFDQNLQLKEGALAQHHAEFTDKTKIDLASKGLIMHDDGSVELDTTPGSPTYERAQSIARYQMPMPSNPGGRNTGMYNQLAALVNQISLQETGQPYDQTKFSAKTAAATSGARASASRLANLEIISKNLDKVIPQAEAASAQVPRGKWVPINQLIQQGKIATSDPAMTVFAQTNLQVAEMWARAMNPTGVMREGDRDLALRILSTASDPQTYKQQLQVLKNLVQREQETAQEVKQEITSPGTPAAPATAAPTAGGGGGKVTRYDSEGNPVQ